MSDLISRKALLEVVYNNVVPDKNGNWTFTKPIIDAIANAPAKEQGEPLGWLLIEGVKVIFYRNKHPEATFSDGFIEKYGNKLTAVYTTPQQPQEQDELVKKAVADALEEAAKICDDNLMSWADDDWNGAAKDCAKRIRTLIKHNAEGGGVMSELSNEKFANGISHHLMETMGLEVKVKVEREELCKHGLILYGNKCINCAREIEFTPKEGE